GSVSAARLRTGNSPHPQSGSSSPPQTIAKPDQQEAALLEPDKRIERSLTGVETHRYQLRLQKGQCAVIRVEQRGINVAVQLLGSDNNPLVEVDDEISKQGTEKLDWVADHDDTYSLVVNPRVKTATGAYAIELVEVHDATSVDRTLHESRQLRTKALQLLALGKRQEALVPAQQALSLAQQALGASDEYVGLLTRDLAEIAYRNGKTADAISGFEQALQMLTAKLGAEHPQTLQTKSRVGYVAYTELEDTSRADQLLSQPLEGQERLLGSEDPQLAVTLQFLALLHKNRGDFAAADREFQRALAIREGAGMTDDLDYARLLNDTAILFINQGKLDEAEIYLDRVRAFKQN